MSMFQTTPAAAADPKVYVEENLSNLNRALGVTAPNGCTYDSATDTLTLKAGASVGTAPLTSTLTLDVTIPGSMLSSVPGEGIQDFLKRAEARAAAMSVSPPNGDEFVRAIAAECIHLQKQHPTLATVMTAEIHGVTYKMSGRSAEPFVDITVNHSYTPASASAMTSVPVTFSLTNSEIDNYLTGTVSGVPTPEIPVGGAALGNLKAIAAMKHDLLETMKARGFDIDPADGKFVETDSPFRLKLTLDVDTVQELQDLQQKLSSPPLTPASTQQEIMAVVDSAAVAKIQGAEAYVQEIKNEIQRAHPTLRSSAFQELFDVMDRHVAGMSPSATASTTASALGDAKRVTDGEPTELGERLARTFPAAASTEIRNAFALAMLRGLDGTSLGTKDPSAPAATGPEVKGLSMTMQPTPAPGCLAVTLTVPDGRTPGAPDIVSTFTVDPLKVGPEQLKALDDLVKGFSNGAPGPVPDLDVSRLLNGGALDRLMPAVEPAEVSQLATMKAANYSPAVGAGLVKDKAVQVFEAMLAGPPALPPGSYGAVKTYLDASAAHIDPARVADSTTASAAVAAITAPFERAIDLIAGLLTPASEQEKFRAAVAEGIAAEFGNVAKPLTSSPPAAEKQVAFDYDSRGQVLSVTVSPSGSATGATVQFSRDGGSLPGVQVDSLRQLVSALNSSSPPTLEQFLDPGAPWAPVFNSSPASIRTLQREARPFAPISAALGGTDTAEIGQMTGTAGISRTASGSFEYTGEVKLRNAGPGYPTTVEIVPPADLAGERALAAALATIPPGDLKDISKVIAALFPPPGTASVAESVRVNGQTISLASPATAAATTVLVNAAVGIVNLTAATGTRANELGGRFEVTRIPPGHPGAGNFVISTFMNGAPGVSIPVEIGLQPRAGQEGALLADLQALPAALTSPSIREFQRHLARLSRIEGPIQLNGSACDLRQLEREMGRLATTAPQYSPGRDLGEDHPVGDLRGQVKLTPGATSTTIEGNVLGFGPPATAFAIKLTLLPDTTAIPGSRAMNRFGAQSILNAGELESLDALAGALGARGKADIQRVSFEVNGVTQTVDRADFGRLAQIIRKAASAPDVTHTVSPIAPESQLGTVVRASVSTDGVDTTLTFTLKANGPGGTRTVSMTFDDNPLSDVKSLHAGMAAFNTAISGGARFDLSKPADRAAVLAFFPVPDPARSTAFAAKFNGAVTDNATTFADVTRVNLGRALPSVPYRPAPPAGTVESHREYNFGPFARVIVSVGAGAVPLEAKLLVTIGADPGREGMIDLPLTSGTPPTALSANEIARNARALLDPSSPTCVFKPEAAGALPHAGTAPSQADLKNPGQWRTVTATPAPGFTPLAAGVLAMRRDQLRLTTEGVPALAGATWSAVPAGVGDVSWLGRGTAFAMVWEDGPTPASKVLKVIGHDPVESSSTASARGNLLPNRHFEVRFKFDGLDTNDPAVRSAQAALVQAAIVRAVTDGIPTGTSKVAFTRDAIGSVPAAVPSATIDGTPILTTGPERTYTPARNTALDPLVALRNAATGGTLPAFTVPAAPGDPSILTPGTGTHPEITVTAPASGSGPVVVTVKLDATTGVKLEYTGKNANDVKTAIVEVLKRGSDFPGATRVFENFKDQLNSELGVTPGSVPGASDGVLLTLGALNTDSSLAPAGALKEYSVDLFKQPPGLSTDRVLESNLFCGIDADGRLTVRVEVETGTGRLAVGGVVSPEFLRTLPALSDAQRDALTASRRDPALYQPALTALTQALKDKVAPGMRSALAGEVLGDNGGDAIFKEMAAAFTPAGPTGTPTALVITRIIPYNVDVRISPEMTANGAPIQIGEEGKSLGKSVTVKVDDGADMRGMYLAGSEVGVFKIEKTTNPGTEPKIDVFQMVSRLEKGVIIVSNTTGFDSRLVANRAPGAVTLVLGGHNDQRNTGGNGTIKEAFAVLDSIVSMTDTSLRSAILAKLGTPAVTFGPPVPEQTRKDIMLTMLRGAKFETARMDNQELATVTRLLAGNFSFQPAIDGRAVPERVPTDAERQVVMNKLQRVAGLAAPLAMTVPPGPTTVSMPFGVEYTMTAPAAGTTPSATNPYRSSVSYLDPVGGGAAVRRTENVEAADIEEFKKLQYGQMIDLAIALDRARDPGYGGKPAEFNAEVREEYEGRRRVRFGLAAPGGPGTVPGVLSFT